MPGGVEGFGANFVRAEVGLRHRFTHCDRMNFRQFAVCVEEKALLRDVDNDVMALWNRRDIGNGRVGQGRNGRQ